MTPTVELDHLDKKIIGLLISDARKPFLEVAKACGVSGAAIHQRIQRLTAAGVIRGTQYNVAPEMVGYQTCAFIGLNLKNPEDSEDVVEALSQMPEVVECHFATGSYDMMIKVYTKNNKMLLDFIHEKLQPLGLMRSETTISFSQVISRPITVQ